MPPGQALRPWTTGEHPQATHTSVCQQDTEHEGELPEYAAHFGSRTLRVLQKLCRPSQQEPLLTGPQLTFGPLLQGNMWKVRVPH